MGEEISRLEERLGYRKICLDELAASKEVRFLVFCAKVLTKLEELEPLCASEESLSEDFAFV